MILTFYALACGGFCSFVAKEKKRDPVYWFVSGGLFGIIALIALAAIPSKNSST